MFRIAANTKPLQTDAVAYLWNNSNEKRFETEV